MTAKQPTQPAKVVNVKFIQPMIDIKVPQVRLDLKHLTYLRGLASGNGTTCHLDYNHREKLELLGLTTTQEFTPTKADIRKVEASRKVAAATVRKLVREKKWTEAKNAIQSLLYITTPTSQKRTVLTCAGKELLAKGEVRTRLAGKGCA